MLLREASLLSMRAVGLKVVKNKLSIHALRLEQSHSGEVVLVELSAMVLTRARTKRHAREPGQPNDRRITRIAVSYLPALTTATSKSWFDWLTMTLSKVEWVSFTVVD